MGGGRQRAASVRPSPTSSVIPAPSLSVIPAQAGTAQAGTTHPNAHNQHAPTNSPKKIHPSPLLGGRLGGGWDVPSGPQLPSNTPIASRHSCAGRNGGCAQVPAYAGMTEVRVQE